MNVGIIGLGAMGSGMARSLARDNLLAGVWNRTQSRADALASELFVPVAPTPALLAGQCDIIITCVAADQDVLEVIDAMKPGLAPDKVVVDTSTIGVVTVRDAAYRVAERGARFLDAPVSGGEEGAEQGELVVMVGGNADALARAMPALAAIGRAVTHMGDCGSGQATKAVNQVMAAGINQAVTEALAFGEAMALDLDRVIGVVGGGAAGNWFLNQRGPNLVRGIYEPGFRAALHHKDLSLCRDLLDSMGVSLPIVEMTLKHYERLMDQGHGDEDISALHRLKRDMFKRGNKLSL